MASAVSSSYALYSSSAAASDVAPYGYKMNDPTHADPAAFSYEAYSQYTPAPPSSVSSVSSVGSSAKKDKIGGDRSLTISTNAPMGLSPIKNSTGSKAPKTSPASPSKEGNKENPRPEHLKPRLCTVPGCKKRVRSKGLCKAHGGGRRCMVEGCERSSQGQGLCIRHGGGKRCTQPGCTKASQSNGLCKAHGGGLRCQAPNCTKSSQGGGYCRAHGGGQRCEKEGCNKGAQRGGFCAGHGGSRFCQHPDCTKNDRGGGFCAEHGGGKRCDQQGCNKPARKKGKCSYHANANKQKTPKEPVATATPMMDMRQITAPVYNGMNGMGAMPKDVMRESMEPHPSIRAYPPVSGYSRMDMDQRYSKGYDQPLPMSTNSTSSQYMMHSDQRGYEAMGMSAPAPRHYMGSMDSSLPSVSSGYSSTHKHQSIPTSMAAMDRSVSQYNPAPREMPKSSHSTHQYPHWAQKDAVTQGLSDRTNFDYFDMKGESASHHQPYGSAPPTQYHHHLSAADSAAAAAAYGNQRDSYYHHAPSSTGEAPAGPSSMMYNSYGYQPHQMHSMSSMNLL